MFRDEGDFHSSGLILGPDNQVTLVRNLRKSTPLWKFPGGKKQLTELLSFKKQLRGETPVEAFIREVEEETGLRIKKRLTEYIASDDMGHYKKHYFFSRIYSLRKLRLLSKEYEEAKVFNLGDLDWLPDFHPDYRRAYEQYFKPRLKDL